MNTTTSSTPPASERLARPTHDLVRRVLAKRSTAVLSTVSSSGRPHAATVLYALDGDAMYISTLTASRKARNVAANPWAGVVVPVRRLPVGPPASIQFQAPAEVVPGDDPALRDLAAAGRIDAVTSHGELDLTEGCFIRVTVPGRIHTYGLGLPLWQFIRNPLEAGATVEGREAS